MTADLTPRLDQLGQDARALWLAGASQFDILLYVVTPLGGWTSSDPDHLGLIEALGLVRERVQASTPP